MRKKSTYLVFLALIAIVVAFAYILNIVVLKNMIAGIIRYIQSSWILALAAVSAFIFANNRYYWMVNIACAVVVSIVLQLVVFGGSLGLWVIIYQSLAFLSVVYLLNLIKVLITK